MDNNEQALSNASAIKREIERLKTGHYEVGAFGVIQNYRYGEFWAHAKEIGEKFKTLKPLSGEDRERLWKTYQETCENMKGTQNDEREKSRINRGNIEYKIKEAYSAAGGSTDISGVDADKEMLDKAKAMQTENLNMMGGSKLTKEDREACWKYWREVNGSIDSKVKQTQQMNYWRVDAEAGDAFNAAYSGDPYDALNMIKSVQKIVGGAYLEQYQRTALRDKLDDAWQKATSRIGEKKEEKRKKHEDWRERMEDNIARWEGRIEGSEAFISRLEGQIEELGDKVRNAWSANYVLTASGWIVEKYAKIAEVREQIGDLEAKIEDVKAKLEG